jgi:hypothetical protein
MSDIGNTVMEELRARRNRLAVVRNGLAALTKQERREVLAETLEAEETDDVRISREATGPVVGPMSAIGSDRGPTMPLRSDLSQWDLHLKDPLGPASPAPPVGPVVGPMSAVGPTRAMSSVRHLEALSILKTYKGGATSSVIAKRLGVSSSMIRGVLARLVDNAHVTVTPRRGMAPIYKVLPKDES